MQLIYLQQSAHVRHFSVGQGVVLKYEGKERENYLTYIYNKPSSRARATASVRRWTCSLSKILRLCPLTVSRARKSRFPISSLESPWAMSCRTSSSRGVKGSTKG